MSKNRQRSNRLLLIYNTCGISNQENDDHYVHALRAILSEANLEDCVVISACLNAPRVKMRLLNQFASRGVNFNFIEEKLPVNVTFNHSVLQTVKRRGRFAGYMYIDSGITLRPGTLTGLRRRVESNHCAMIAAECANDTGYKWWFGTETLPGTAPDFHMPIGKTTNLHAQVFSDELFEAYDHRIIPDIFASWSTESVFTFMCAAIKKKFCVCRGLLVDHIINMDGGASGFRDGNFGHWDHTFRSPRTMTEIIADPEGISAGFGYEEFRQVLMHDPSQFDENLHCKNEKLREFIKQNLFLPKDRLDYETVAHTYVEGGG